MVVGAFPIAKLGSLLIRQVSKPIANMLIRRAKNYPFFRQYVCMPPAQFYNWCEVQCKMWILNLGKPVNIPPLNEAMAIELGANLIGEGLIFMIAVGVLYSEYSRQVRKDKAKEDARQEEIQRLNMILEDLYFQSEKQDAQIRELMRAVNDLQGRVIHKPWMGRRDSPPPSNPPTPPSPQSRLPLLPVPDKDEGGTSNPKPSFNSVKCRNGGVILNALDYFEYEVRGRPYHISES
ncbi:hypothetical protein ANN_16770 [Periplaneta americana]|uniref:OPA3-like protein CG13603 n=1 Tax=Periplaneta americana TaxID=6978 RepID=A0ABQ8SS60_PERAM|nr:hypothetical protein ANN_16770 [Periplaneta americana]